MSPEGAVNINVGGRRVAGPVQGFGKLWKKTYRVPVGDAVEPAEVVATWRRDFGSFWPPGSRFYGPLTGLEPGEVALLNLTMPGGLELSTGVLVLYADDEAFTLMTPEGHQFAGWITFSAFADPSRAPPPRRRCSCGRATRCTRSAWSSFGHRIEDRFWAATLTALAKSLGVTDPQVARRRRVHGQEAAVEARRQRSLQLGGAVGDAQGAATRSPRLSLVSPAPTAGRGASGGTLGVDGARRTGRAGGGPS